MRPLRCIECNGLTVEHQRIHRESAHFLDDFRHRAGHFVQPACIDADVARHLVDLDARAVHFPVERDFARKLPHGFGYVGGGLREHRRYRREQFEPESAERIGSFEQCHAGHSAQVFRIHGGAAHLRCGQICGRRDRVDHDPEQRTLSQFPHQQAKEERLLSRCRP